MEGCAKRLFENGCGSSARSPFDADGRLLIVNLTTAEITAGAYDRTKLLGNVVFRDFVLEILIRTDKDPDLKVLPRRRVVERSFG